MSIKSILTIISLIIIISCISPIITSVLAIFIRYFLKLCKFIRQLPGITKRKLREFGILSPLKFEYRDIYEEQAAKRVSEMFKAIEEATEHCADHIPDYI